MASKKKSAKTQPIFQWTFKGTDVAGTTPVYTTQLKDNGSLSCNCPGWVFARKGKPRECKHTRSVFKEAPGLYKKWRQGEELPKIMSDPLAAMVFGGKSGSSIQATEYGRVIELD